MSKRLVPKKLKNIEKVNEISKLIDKPIDEVIYSELIKDNKEDILEVNNKMYDEGDNVVIGNFMDTKLPYQISFQKYRSLSPYNTMKVNWKNKSFPSLINFFYFLRLCYKNVKDELYELPPDKVLSHYLKNESKCNKLFKNLGEKIGLKNMESVESYLIRITTDALNILYEVYMRNTLLQDLLITTGDRPIIFVNYDKILGDGLNGEGMNLFGKKLEELRQYFKERRNVESIVEKKIPELMDLKLEFRTKKEFINYSNGDMNVLEKWAYKMMLMYANAIGCFFNYLCKNRTNYIPVNRKSNVDVEDLDENKFILKGEYYQYKSKFLDVGGKYEKSKGWIFPKNMKRNVLTLIYTDAFMINPILNLNIVSYVARELFHCSIGNEFQNVSFPQMPNGMEITIDNMVRVFIEDSDLRSLTKVTSQACSYLWMHVCMLCEHILESAEDRVKNNKEMEADAISNILNMAQSSVENMKKEYIDHGFPTEIENCVMQAVVYNIVGLTDWLGLDEVGEDEYKSCVDILTFNMKEGDISSDKVSVEGFENVVRAFMNKGLVIDRQTSERIVKFVKKLSNKCDTDGDCLNRVMFFSNVI